MNTKRSNNSNRVKSFGLAACAVVALGALAAGEVVAQCRIGGNAGFGNSAGYRGLDNGFNYGSRFNNRFNAGYGRNAPLGYNAPQRYDVPLGYNTQQRYNGSLGYSAPQRYNAPLDCNNTARGLSSPSFGLNDNRNRSYSNGFGDWGTSGFGNRSNLGNGFLRSSREPVSYRHGNHIDVEDGNRRIHLRGRGF